MIKESTLKFFITGLATEAQLSCSHILQSCILQGNFEMQSGSTVRILVHLGQHKGFYWTKFPSSEIAYSTADLFETRLINIKSQSDVDLEVNAGRQWPLFKYPNRERAHKSSVFSSCTVIIWYPTCARGIVFFFLQTGESIARSRFRRST